MLVDLDGDPFRSWEDFCRHREPFGLGLSPDQVDAILDQSNAGKRLSAVLGVHGGDRKSEQARKDQARNHEDETLGRSDNAKYVLARLRREAIHNDEARALLEQVDTRTMTPNAAARAMGWRKKPTPYGDMVSGWRRGSDDDRSRFMDFIERWHREQKGAA